MQLVKTSPPRLVGRNFRLLQPAPAGILEEIRAGIHGLINAVQINAGRGLISRSSLRVKRKAQKKQHRQGEHETIDTLLDGLTKAMLSVCCFPLDVQAARRTAA